ncbi:MAG: hypothetical protein U5K27_17030 [Desulfotignum sp.]|nr:hypothetical protein [Desulfotignum sp.]
MPMTNTYTPHNDNNAGPQNFHGSFTHECPVMPICCGCTVIIT